MREFLIESVFQCCFKRVRETQEEEFILAVERHDNVRGRKEKDYGVSIGNTGLLDALHEDHTGIDLNLDSVLNNQDIHVLSSATPKAIYLDTPPMLADSEEGLNLKEKKKIETDSDLVLQNSSACSQMPEDRLEDGLGMRRISFSEFVTVAEMPEKNIEEDQEILNSDETILRSKLELAVHEGQNNVLGDLVFHFRKLSKNMRRCVELLRSEPQDSQLRSFFEGFRVRLEENKCVEYAANAFLRAYERSLRVGSTSSSNPSGGLYFTYEQGNLLFQAILKLGYFLFGACDDVRSLKARVSRSIICRNDEERERISFSPSALYRVMVIPSSGTHEDFSGAPLGDEQPKTVRVGSNLAFDGSTEIVTRNLVAILAFGELLSEIRAGWGAKERSSTGFFSGEKVYVRQDVKVRQPAP